MSVERLAKELSEKIEYLGFTSAKFQYALVKDDKDWKVFTMRVVFDYSNKSGQQNSWINETNFILEDYWLNMEQFYKFMDYLKTVDVTKDSMVNGLFKLNDLDLPFKGNFPGGSISFLRSQLGKDHGFQRAVSFIQYYFHGSVKANAYQVTLTHHEPPFRNIVEAINYYWKANYDLYSMGSTQLAFYLPLYDASIKRCSVDSRKIEVELDIDYKRVSPKELSVAVIAQGPEGQYRKKHVVSSDSLSVDLEFEPTIFSLILNKGATMLDEYHYYRQDASPVTHQDAVDNYLAKHPQTRNHIIFVDAGYNPLKGGSIAWFNETTGEIFHSPQECSDSFRCEWAAVEHALKNFKEFRSGEEVEIRSDNLTVIKQLAHEYAINDEDTRRKAMAIWNDVAKRFHGKVKFIYVPRELNKAGKVLGS